MLNKTRYSFCIPTHTLKIGRGRDILNADHNNGQFFPWVALFNKLQPKKIVISGTNSRDFLLIIRALVHSQLAQFELCTFLDLNLHNYEDDLYIISKSFGAQAVCIKRANRKKYFFIKFKITRQFSRFSRPIDFYIITNGKNLDSLARCVKSIVSQKTSVPVKIYLVAPGQFAESIFMQQYPQCQLLADDMIYGQDKRFPLSKKKNLALAHSQAEIVVIMHDRLWLSENWLERLLGYAPKFDFYTCKIMAEGRRYPDKFALKFKGYPFWKKNHYFLTYQEDNADQLIDGGFIVLNRSTLANARFDDALHWGEMEDVEFVLRQKLDAKLITFDALNVVYSTYAGHFSLSVKNPFSYFYKTWFKRTFFAGYIDRLLRYWRKYRVKGSSGVKH